jgi:hypothetical protein
MRFFAAAETYGGSYGQVSDIIRDMREEGSDPAKKSKPESERDSESVESFSQEEIAELGNLLSGESIEESSQTNEPSTSEDDTGEFQAIRDPE